MKHIKTLNTQTLNNTMKKGGCGECQTSCQSACKTSGSGFGRCFVFALRRKEQNTSDSSVCK